MEMDYNEHLGIVFARMKKRYYTFLSSVHYLNLYNPVTADLRTTSWIITATLRLKEKLLTFSFLIEQFLPSIWPGKCSRPHNTARSAY